MVFLAAIRTGAMQFNSYFPTCFLVKRTAAKLWTYNHGTRTFASSSLREQNAKIKETVDRLNFLQTESKHSDWEVNFFKKLLFKKPIYDSSVLDKPINPNFVIERLNQAYGKQRSLQIEIYEQALLLHLLNPIEFSKPSCVCVVDKIKAANS